ncbi:MFS transporter [Actinomadura opuntiae]|uniref:MFS transporter n=1 Tax=Actinomadura sp. OS1-43 TaxID=604315 RepID=UPI00255AB9F5|nr:MFS transporter [Actinomadura sp. OS1-43]MDL4812777.1 MFS transporter [Actinomadura sp. OS1-43]
MGYLRLLRRPRILLLWVGQTLSVLGDRMYALAVMWLVWEATKSAALMGLVAVVESVPYILVGLWGRRVLARCGGFGPLALIDVGRLMAVAALPVIWTVSGPSVTALLVVAGVLGLLGAVFDPSMGALVPDLVRAEDVQQVSGLMDLMGRIARIAGPGSAGLLLLVLPDVQLYTVDAATFAISAAALLVLARSSRPGATAERPGRPDPERPARSGRSWGLVLRYPVTGCMIGVHAAGQMLAGVTLVLPVLVAQRIGAGPEVYAAAGTAAGVGAVAANMIAGNARWASVIPGAYCLAWAAEGAVMIVTGMSWTTWQVIALSGLSGAVSPFIGVGLRTHLSGFGRGERLGLLTVDQTLLRAAGTAGTAALPVLAGHHPAAGYVTGGAATIAVAGAGWIAAAVLGNRAAPTQPETASASAR